MAEKPRVFPIPCRKCGKLALFPIVPGRHPLHCVSCNAITDVTVRRRGPGWEIRTALASAETSRRG
jgi:hypothetical protein